MTRERRDVSSGSISACEVRHIGDPVISESPRPAAAQRIADGIKEWARLLAQSPQMGRSREDLAAGVRSVVVEKKYLVFFRVAGNDVQILRVVHGSRDITSSMFDHD